MLTGPQHKVDVVDRLAAFQLQRARVVGRLGLVAVVVVVVVCGGSLLALALARRLLCRLRRRRRRRWHDRLVELERDVWQFAKLLHCQVISLSRDDVFQAQSTRKHTNFLVQLVRKQRRAARVLPLERQCASFACENVCSCASNNDALTGCE